MATTTDTAFYVPPAAQEAIVKYCKAASTTLHGQWAIREQLLANDAAYMRERNYGSEHQRAKVANMYGDKSRIQDVVVPIVLPQVESGVSYLSSVFLSGYPIFSTVSSPTNVDAATMMDTIIGEQSIRGAWVREFNLFFRDGLKHNLAALEIEWGKESIYSVESLPADPAGVAKAKEQLWQGNKIRRLDPYNLIFDQRVHPARMHLDGDFSGYVELKTRTALKQLLLDIAEVKLANDKAAFESSSTQTFYIPQINPQAMVESATAGAGFNWLAWATAEAANKIRYNDAYEVTTLYARIIPSDFGLKVPGRNQPQIWKFMIVNQSVLILAERQTNAHNKLPILLSQPLEDGLGYQTKSFAQNVQPYQEVCSAIVNASLHARRRAVYDRILYDPSRVRKEDINSSNPIARIPIRPAGYGKPLSESVFPFPYRDDNSTTAFQQVALLQQMANNMQGINPAQQGQFVKGNKTQHEYADVMQHSNARLQTLAMFIEAQTMVPLKEILKLNILQYTPAMKLYNRDTKTEVAIDPLKLRETAVEFQLSDGMLPSEKLINAETFQTIMQIAPVSPQLSTEFRLTEFLIYYLKSTGAKHLEEFRYTPEEKQQMQQQAIAMEQAKRAPATGGNNGNQA